MRLGHSQVARSGGDQIVLVRFRWHAQQHGWRVAMRDQFTFDSLLPADLADALS